MSVGEAARRLGVTRAAIYGRVERGTLRTRPKGNRGVEVLLPADVRQGDVTPDGNGDVRGDGNGDGQGDVTLTSRVEELLERAVRAETRAEAVAALAKSEVEAVRRIAAAEVEAIRRQRDAELEAMRGELRAGIAARNAVIETMQETVTRAEERADRLEAELTRARRPLLLRLVEAVRRRG